MSEAVGKRALGTPYLRVDALSKTSGRARYTDDLPMPVCTTPNMSAVPLPTGW